MDDLKKIKEYKHAIFGLIQYLPFNIVANNIMPFAFPKPFVSCKICHQILYTQTPQYPISWTIGYQGNLTCVHCFNAQMRRKSRLRELYMRTE